MSKWRGIDFTVKWVPGLLVSQEKTEQNKKNVSTFSLAWTFWASYKSFCMVLFFYLFCFFGFTEVGNFVETWQPFPQDLCDLFSFVLQDPSPDAHN